MVLARYFPTWGIERLLTESEKVQTQIAQGKMATSAGAGDISGSFQREQSLDETLRRLYCDLSTLDPDSYPITNLRPRSTTALFATGDNQ